MTASVTKAPDPAAVLDGPGEPGRHPRTRAARPGRAGHAVDESSGSRSLLSRHTLHLLSSVGRVPCVTKEMKLRDVNSALHRQSCHVIS